MAPQGVGAVRCASWSLTVSLYDSSANGDSVADGSEMDTRSAPTNAALEDAARPAKALWGTGPATWPGEMRLVRRHATHATHVCPVVHGENSCTVSLGRVPGCVHLGALVEYEAKGRVQVVAGGRDPVGRCAEGFMAAIRD